MQGRRSVTWGPRRRSATASSSLRLLRPCSWGDDRVATRPFPVPGLGTGWHLDRRRFDQDLAALVTCRGGSAFVDAAVAVAREAGTREAGTREAGGWAVTVLRSDRGSGSLSARFVIDASGSAAVLARREGATWRVDDRLTGCVAVYTTPPGTSIGPTLVESVEDGWWYSSPAPGDRMVVADMTDPDLLPGRGLDDVGGWDDLLGATRHTGERVVGDLVLGPQRRPLDQLTQTGSDAHSAAVLEKFTGSARRHFQSISPLAPRILCISSWHPVSYKLPGQAATPR